MGLDEALMRQLRAAFEAEAAEHLEGAGRLLVRMERLPTRDPEREEALSEVFRMIHSLKGAARAVSLTEVQGLSHHLESLLGAARAGQVSLGPAHFTLMLRALDGLGALVKAGLAGTTPPANTEALGAELEAARHMAAAPPPPPEAPAPAAEPRSGDETIRVAVGKVDELLALTGELSATELRLDQHLSDLKALAAAIDRRENQTALSKQAKQMTRSLMRERARLASLSGSIREAVQQLRVLPADLICQPLHRVVRDLATEQGKAARLEIEGGDTTVDKRLLERLKDPLLHLVRNAVDHGIEPSAVRLVAGKSEAGTVRVAVRLQGNRLLIEVADDGAGIDPERLKTAALDTGTASLAELAAMSRTDALELIFRPGLTTRDRVTEVSGRGIGLDVVRRNVEALHGRLEVQSLEGQGTAIRLLVPLDVTTVEGLLVEVAGQLLAVPVSAVDRVWQVPPEAMRTAGGEAALLLDGRPVAAVHLGALLGLPAARPTAGQRQSVVVLGGAGNRVALLVDRLAGEQPMVVKGLGRHLVRVRNVAGATVLGSGQPVVVLNPIDLMRSATRGGSRPPVHAALVAPTTAADSPRPGRILVADDSITTRTLERTILEAAGYDVRTAADGLEAWRLLRTEPFDLVVTDVEMPGLTGLGLTERIRADEALRELPVILVTSMESRADKERGIQVGADAYVVKSGFDQEHLLSVVRQLI